MRQHRGNGYPVIMAKCHYVLDDGPGAGWRVAGRMGDRYHGF